VRKKIVEVSWVDPTTEAGWIEDDNHTQPLPTLKSYGILVSKSKKLVVLAGSYDPDQKKYADRFKWPTGCVKDIRVIEEVEL
jgi:hypothetical protein